MSRTDIAKAYIEHLAAGNLAALLMLFAEGGIVVSPVYGTMDYRAFYEQLFKDTQDSQLHIKGIFEDATTGQLALHFDYGWTLRNGSFVSFEVVDIIEFDATDKIKKLTIIYDTVRSRELVAGLSD